MECTLRFKQNSAGRLMVYWDQEGWSSTQCAVVHFGPNESKIAHKSIDMRNPGWGGVAQDILRMESPTYIEGRSHIEQFQFGRQIGAYETVSMLSRIQ